MIHGRLITALLLLGVVMAGCTENPVITAQTHPSHRVAMDLIGQPDDVIHMRIKRPDDVVIDAWGLKAGQKPVVGTAVILHGTGETKAGYLGIARNLAKDGYDLVLLDLRCHGKSTGKYITCGAKEKKDVKAVVDAMVKEQKFAAKPIYVFGVTFGAAVAIQYAAIEPNVAGVVAIAPWQDTASKADRDLGLMSAQEQCEKIDEAGNLADFDPWTTSALIDAEKLKCPVLLIHGAFDLVVPLDDSKAIYKALKSPKELKIITPGPEQLAVGLSWEKWVPEQIERVEKKDFGKTPTTQPK